MKQLKSFLSRSLLAAFLGIAFLAPQMAQADFIPWHKLKNPVYQHFNWSTKDASMIYHPPTKTFYLFFGGFFESDGRIRSHVVGVKTKDFAKFSDPLFIWHGPDLDYKGFAAPEVVKIKDEYIITYNGWGDKLFKINKLFYRTSKDLENWSEPKELARKMTGNRRAIDAALAYHKGMYVLSWKEGQTPALGVAPSLNGPWTRLERPIKQWMENSHFINIGGKWNMVFTAGKHMPHIAPMVGTGDNILDWQSWQTPRQFNIPLESFNTHDRANSGHLQDWRKYDGYFYLLYAGSTEGDSYLGRGDNRLGLARSKDLVNWEVP